MGRTNVKTGIAIGILVAVALLSFFVWTESATSVSRHEKEIQILDEKRTTVLELTAAATAASAAVTLLPDDTGTPIAEKLADLSSDFLIVLSAIVLEKYLLTITGFAAFKILIPIACAIMIFGLIVKSRVCYQLAVKMALFALAIYWIIPLSLQISSFIEDTYSTSIEQTIESAKQSTSDITNETESENDKKDEGILSGIISKVENGVSGAIDNMKNILSKFIEALAMLIVTSCIIPIVVMVFFIWIIKSILGVNFDFARFSSRTKQNKIEQN